MIKTLKISALLAVNVMLWWATLQLLTAERVPMFMTPQQVEDFHDWDDLYDEQCEPAVCAEWNAAYGADYGKGDAR